MPRSNYVYRSTRVGSGVERTYLGTLADPAVRAVERTSQLVRASRQAEREAVTSALGIIDAVDRVLATIHSEANRTIRNLRKRWKRAKESPIPRPKMKPQNLTYEEYTDLVDDASHGDQQALDQLRQHLRGKPELCHLLGDLNRHVQQHLIDLAADGLTDVRESIAIRLADTQAQLLKEGDSLLEQLLVDQVLSTMLDAACCQLGASQAYEQESIRRRWENRLARAQQRHQTAIASLIELRKMLEPQ